MVVTNRKHPDEDPPAAHDESWWESVLSDEGRFAKAPSGKETSHRSRQSQSESRSHSSAADSRTSAQGEERQGKSAHTSEPLATLSHADWAYAMEVYKQDQIVTLTVTNYNRGGLLVEAERLEGFVPYSHLIDMACQNELERDHFLSEYIG